VVDRLRGGALDRLAAVAVWAVAIGITATFGWVVADLLRGGIGRIGWEFLVAGPTDAGRSGGVGPMLVSTALIVGVCATVAVPVGLGTAILLAEYTPRTGRFGRWVRRSLDVLAGVPSIVFGLFGSVLFCKVLGLGFSILAGGLTLACMALPIVVRATEQGFAAVPDEVRIGAAALGLSRSGTLFQLVLPAASPGLVVGLVLGIGRATAETAALIFTSGYVDRMPGSLLDSGRALSVHILDLSMNVPGGTNSAYASALVLLGLLLVIDATASWLAERWLGGRIVGG
jgi:phosphate transport system permease protein